MWEHGLVTSVDVPADRLWGVLADVHGWPNWDRVDGQSRGEPRPGLRVERCESPRWFEYVVPLPLAWLRSSYEFVPAGDSTRVRVVVRVSGPLGFVWRRLAPEAQSAWLAG